jgi:hypothetical protein
VVFVALKYPTPNHSLLGIGDKRPDWRLRRKRRPLPWRYTMTMLATQVVLEWLPYLEELLPAMAVATRPQDRTGGQNIGRPPVTGIKAPVM